jgi:hypothetical protein
MGVMHGLDTDGSRRRLGVGVRLALTGAAVALAVVVIPPDAGAASRSVHTVTTRTLTITPSPIGYGHIGGPGIDCGSTLTPSGEDCTETYPVGTIIELHATGLVVPLTSFELWGKDCASAGSGTACTLVMTTSHTACGIFSGSEPGVGPFNCINNRTVTMTIDPSPIGYGHLGGPGIDCGSTFTPSGEDCTETYPEAPVNVEFYATGLISPPTEFEEWGGDCSANSTTTCSLNIGSSHVACAVFDGPSTGTGPPGCT